MVRMIASRDCASHDPDARLQRARHDRAAIADALGAELPVADAAARDHRRRLDRRHARVARAGRPAGQRRGRPPREEPAARARRSARGSSTRRGTYSAILDADLEYAAADLGPVLEPLLAGKANVVFGTRAWTSQSSFSFWYVMGNKSVTMATNVLYNCWISDVMTCHKAMSTELFRSLRLRERGFAIEPEIAARVLQSGERIYEVPIGYAARSRDEGKKLTAVDGLRVLRTLVRCKFA